jgi:hypothetical protein
MDAMKYPQWLGAVMIILILAGQGLGDQRDCAATPRLGFWQWLAPAGGWHPYGGGLLHWWNPYCFPRSGGTDDYCRKPLPNVCWPGCAPCANGGTQAADPFPLPLPQNLRKMP